MDAGQCLRVLRGQMLTTTTTMMMMVMLIFDCCHAVDITVAVGGTIFLRPPTAPRGDIGWKHGGNQVLEYEKGVLDLFNIFQGRTELDRVTGEVKISNATKAHSGTYVLYVGHVEQPEKYRVSVIDRVRKPTVVIISLACPPESSSCNFNCQSDVTGAGPVVYSWKIGDQWTETRESMSFELKNTAHTRKSEDIYCRISNPVSEEVSDAFKQPFTDPRGHLSPGEIVGIVVGLIILMVLIGICIYCYKTGLLARLIQALGIGQDYDPANAEERSDKRGANNAPV